MSYAKFNTYNGIELIAEAPEAEMKNNKSIIFYGGDRRILAASECFKNDGFDCCNVFYDFNEKYSNIPYNTDYIILPIPSFVEGTKINCVGNIPAEHLFNRAKTGTVIFGAMIPDFIFRMANEYNLSVYDYANREEFSVLNAVPTAEAAIICAAGMIDKTIFGTRFDIVGYGRIGKALSHRLSALGGIVNIAARSPGARSMAEADGLKTYTLSEYLKSPSDCDILFNTVPCRIIGKEAVLDSNSIYIDLASKPGGFTQEAEMLLGDRLIHALSLPGKYSPVSAGEIIYKTVKSIINEIGG